MARMSSARPVLLFGLLVLSGVPALASPFVINEVVADPKSDWDDSSGVAGEPFDQTPGPTPPSSSGTTDEYIELKNVSGSVQSLTGYVLEMNDNTPAFERFDPGAASDKSEYYRVFNSSGGRVLGDPLDAVPAGGYVVLGNPAGDLTLTISLVLKDAGSATVDQVVIGGTGNPSADADSAADEALSRFPDGTDTGAGTADFVQRSSTLGRSNGTFCTVAAGQAVVNEAVGDPQTDWDGSGGIDGDHDEYIELKNVSGSALSFVGCALDMVDTSPASFLFFDVDSGTAPRVEVHAANGALLGTAPALAAVPNGGYVLLIDPPGQMNATGTTTVTLRSGPPGGDTVDELALQLDADGTTDEALSRFPDGTGDPIAKSGSPGRSNGLGSVGTPGQQLINEVVITPFEDQSGDGVISSSDQAIELLNKSGQTIDLTGWTLKRIDSSPVIEPIGGFGTVAFSAGGSVEAWKPNEYVKLVRAGGQMNSDVYIMLLDFEGNPIDDVEIGGKTAATDYEGDGTGDGAPESGSNGAAFGVGDSAIARAPDGTDTGNDINDFRAQQPTLGATNNLPGGDVTPPAVDAGNTTAGTGFAVSGLPRLSFTEAIDPGAIGEEKVLLRPSGAFPTDPPIGQSLSLTNADKTVTITPRGVLRYATVYEIFVSPVITDRSGNALPIADPNGIVVASFTTEPAPAENQKNVRINEVVPDPQRDWKGGGFKALAPPQGSNTSLDEWVELYNAGPNTLDLTNFTLNMIDSLRAAQRIGDATTGRVVVCFDGSGTEILTPNCHQSLPPGAYLLIGDPPGSMSSDVYLELRDAAGAVVDTVEIGGGTASSDYGGDGPGNGAPAGGDGDALGLYDESVARVPNGVDTGNELLDWKKQRPTLGRSNDLNAAFDTTPPTVLSAVATRKFLNGTVRADTDLLLTFNEPMDLATISQDTVLLEVGSETVRPSFQFGTNDTTVQVSWTGALSFGRTYTLRVRGNQVGVRDQSRNPDPNKGNPLAQDFTFSFTIELAPAPSTTLVLNEVLSDPQRDWNDSLCGPGLPFDGQTGLNIATSGDEWVEILNKSVRTDLTGYTLVMKDSDYAEHVILADDGTVERYSGDGGNGTIAGLGYLVLGDPPGSMNDNLFVGLRNAAGVLVDAVLVAGGASAPEDEAFARFPNGGDTNSEIVDFTQIDGSILAPNNLGAVPPKPAQPQDVLITELTVDPQNDWNDSGGAAGQPFDQNPGPLNSNPTSSDEYVELANVSGKLLKITGWTLAMVDSSPAFYTLGSDPDIEFYTCTLPNCNAGSASADSFPRGAILVIGNPPGTMNNDVFLELRDLTGRRIDKVEVGGNSPSTNYEADDDQDGQVDEDRIDGEDDDGDGLIDEDPVNPNEPPGDGIPRGGDGNADRPANQAFHRINKTGVDQTDWTRGQPGSPGAANLTGLLKPILGLFPEPLLAALAVLAAALGLGVRSSRSRPLPRPRA